MKTDATSIKSACIGIVCSMQTDNTRQQVKCFRGKKMPRQTKVARYEVLRSGCGARKQFGTELHPIEKERERKAMMNEKNTAIEELKSQFERRLENRATESAQFSLDEMFEIYEEDDIGCKSESLAAILAKCLRSIGERYQDDLKIFDMLDCMNACRNLLDDFPANEDCAFCFLECMTGLLYLKNMMQEDGMIEEYSDEVFEVAERFAGSELVSGTACFCMANMIPLCGGFDAPLSLAYRAVDRIASIAKMHPFSTPIQTVLGHALISACGIALQTENKSSLAEYRYYLKEFLKDKKDVYISEEINQHLRQIEYYL